jgi:hypothetical protein
MNETQYPLILVFYLDAELMRNREIMQPFAEYVNDMIEVKKANIMAFFLPTNDNERVECINPIMMAEPDMERINSMIEEIKVQFSIGMEKDMEFNTGEITPDNNETND